MLVPVRSTIHGHSVLTRGHAVAGHLLVVHRVGDVGAIGLRGTHARSHIVTILGMAAVAVGPRKLVLVAGHVAHAVVDGDNAKGVNHAISRHVVHAIEVLHVSLVAEASGLLGLGVLLNVSLRVGQVARSRGVPTTDGALLEVALQDVTSGKRITTKHAHIRAVASVTKKMALQVLRVQVSLGAVWARELAVGILDGNDVVLCASASGGGGRTARCAGQNSSATLGSYNMGWLVALVKNIVWLHHRSRSIRRGDAGLRHDAPGWHRTKDWRTSPTSWGGSNRLRMRGGRGRLRHHGRRSAIALVGRIWVLSHRVNGGSRRRLRSVLVARQVGRRGWRVGSTGPRRVRVATVERLHGRSWRLQRRQGLGKW